MVAGRLARNRFFSIRGELAIFIRKRAASFLTALSKGGAALG
jgi:hypothetical protein